MRYKLEETCASLKGRLACIPLATYSYLLVGTGYSVTLKMPLVSTYMPYAHVTITARHKVFLLGNHSFICCSKLTPTHLFTLLQAQLCDQDLAFLQSLFGQQGRVSGRYKVSAK